MAYEFRLSIDTLPGKAFTKQYYFGLRAPNGDRAAMAVALEPFLPAPWAKAMISTLKYKPGGQSGDPRAEIYLADLGDWPCGIGEYDATRLHAELLAAGFIDRTEAA